MQGHLTAGTAFAYSWHYYIVHGRSHDLPWLIEFSSVVLSCFVPSRYTCCYGSFTHTTGRLKQTIIVQSNCLFIVMSKELVNRCQKVWGYSGFFFPHSNLPNQEGGSLLIIICQLCRSNTCPSTLPWSRPVWMFWEVLLCSFRTENQYLSEMHLSISVTKVVSEMKLINCFSSARHHH